MSLEQNSLACFIIKTVHGASQQRSTLDQQLGDQAFLTSQLRQNFAVSPERMGIRRSMRFSPTRTQTILFPTQSVTKYQATPIFPAKGAGR